MNLQLGFNGNREGKERYDNNKTGTSVLEK